MPHISNDFQKAVYEIAKAIPPGKVTTYKHIAYLAGYPRYARMVGFFLKQAPTHENIPCHRVVNSQGRTVPGWTEQQDILSQEGVTFKSNGHVNMAHHLWRFDEEEI